jgi:hypothetical protein
VQINDMKTYDQIVKDTRLQELKLAKL